MFPFNQGNLIRCDCGHTAAEHTDAGCTATVAACPCLKAPSTIVIDEIAALRPEWLRPKQTARA
jgi:hypothetical protein